MTAFNRVHPLTTDEQTALVQGTKAKAGFSVRRSHILLLSDQGLTPQQIAERLHCGDQTVRNIIRAFEQEGVGCLQEKSHRPHQDHHVFDTGSLERLEALVHRSPRDFGQATSFWSLPLLAQVCFQAGIVARSISDETVRRALLKLGINWKHARQRITSHDPHYETKKAATTLDRLG
jgi:transposase